MKVKLLNVVLDGTVGGVQMRVLELTPLLQKKGVESVILTPSQTPDFYILASKRGLIVDSCFYLKPKAFRLNFASWLHNFCWALSIPMSIILIARKISKHDCDVVQVNGVAGLQAALAAKLRGKKLVWALIGGPYPSFFVKAVIPLVLFLADKIVFVSRRMTSFYLCDKYVDKQNEKFQVIYECVDCSKFVPTSSTKSFGGILNALELDERDFKVVNIGNFSPTKDHLTLLRAFSIVHDKCPNAKLILIGAPVKGHEKYLKNLHRFVVANNLQEHVRFTGMRTDVHLILPAMDCFVISSVFEAMPIAVLEALSAGVPVIGTRVGGVPEQIVNGESGILIRPGSDYDIARSILYLYNRPEVRKSFGRKGRARAARFFSLEKCADAYYSCFIQLLPKKYRINVDFTSCC